MAHRLRRRRSALAALLLPLIFSLCACETPAQKSVPTEVTPAAQTAPAAPAIVAVDTAKLAQEAAFRDMIALQNRLYRVATPLLVNNPSLCRHRARNLLGFSAKNKYSYSSEYIDNAEKILGLDEQLQVMDLMSGSGAEGAGVQSGDKLVAVNNIPLPQGPNAEHKAGAILMPEIGERTSIELTINRNGADMPIKVPLTRACAFLVVVGNTDQVNSYADGVHVMVTKGMMNAAKSDDELAYVLANEMAHDVLGHAHKLHTRANTARVIANLARLHPAPPSSDVSKAIKPSTPEYEIAADRLGLYMAARAGFSVAQANAFWSRLAADASASKDGSYASTHAINAARLAAQIRVANEIQAKQAANKQLIP